MATKVVEPYKFLKGVGDISIGRKMPDYSFEASIYHDLTQSLDNSLSMYKEVLASKELTPEEKEQYLKLLLESIDEKKADMKKTQNDVDDNRRKDLFVTALITGAGLLVYLIGKRIDSRGK